MHKNVLLILGIVLMSFSSFSQDNGKKVFDYIKECQACTEVVIIAGGLEKKYAGTWFDSIKFENGFIIFSKGNAIHRWNTENVVFVEEGATFIRVYLEQAK